MHDAHVQEFTKFWHALVDELYAKHKPLLVHIARGAAARRLGKQFDAEEALSEMNEPICRSAQKWRPEWGVPFRLYVAKFLWRDVRKWACDLIGPTWKQMPEVAAPGGNGYNRAMASEFLPDHRPGPRKRPLEMWCLSSERREKLPWIGRVVTYLRLVEGYNLSAIAEVFGFSKERARQHFTRTLLKLGIDVRAMDKVYYSSRKPRKKSA